MHAVATFLFEIKIRISLSCSKVSMTLAHRLCMSICTIAHNYTALNALGYDLLNRFSVVHDKGKSAFGVASKSPFRGLVPRTKSFPLQNFVVLDILLESCFATGNREVVRVELVLLRRAESRRRI